MILTICLQLILQIIQHGQSTLKQINNVPEYQ
jgi:hypothetical protein